MQHVKQLVTSLFYAVVYVVILVTVLCWTFAFVLGGCELAYWIVTGTFFHVTPVY